MTTTIQLCSFSLSNYYNKVKFALLAAGGMDWKPYVKLIGERPAAQKVAADRKADEVRIAALRAQGG